MKKSPSEVETVRAEYKRTGNISDAARAIGANWYTARNILERAGDIPRVRQSVRGCPKGQRRPSLRRKLIVAAVEIHGSKTAAARALGISHQAVHQALVREQTGNFPSQV